jgi:hypothetical protein
MPFRREVKPNRQQTLPIESSHPPRLPPSEVCQRGPPSLGGSRHTPARIEKPCMLFWRLISDGSSWF